MRRHGNQLRLTARLVDCAAGQPSWSRTIDRSVDNPVESPIESQEALAQSLSLSLGEHLGAVEPLSFAPTPDQSYLTHLFDESEAPLSDEAPG